MVFYCESVVIDKRLDLNDKIHLKVTLYDFTTAHIFYTKLKTYRHPLRL